MAPLCEGFFTSFCARLQHLVTWSIKPWFYSEERNGLGSTFISFSPNTTRDFELSLQRGLLLLMVMCLQTRWAGGSWKQEHTAWVQG